MPPGLVGVRPYTYRKIYTSLILRLSHSGVREDWGRWVLLPSPPPYIWDGVHPGDVCGGSGDCYGPRAIPRESGVRKVPVRGRPILHPQILPKPPSRPSRVSIVRSRQGSFPVAPFFHRDSRPSLQDGRSRVFTPVPWLPTPSRPRSLCRRGVRGRCTVRPGCTRCLGVLGRLPQTVTPQESRTH